MDALIFESCPVRNEFSLSFEVLIEGEETLLSGLENMILEFGARSCVSSQLMSLPNSSMRKMHSIFPRLLERLGFDDFRILSE